ncbi:hypothetical protein NSB1T_02840 [Coprobacter fastidiosus NSB1 = JCM 33896]|nr:hypothetical protein NSB1T_02840 [Coprobacter fastidiosus NSB1 = JCM 33896]
MTMTDTWESLFKECAVENNHTENYLKECFEYAGSLHQRNLPVIFDFVHLAMYFECCAETLKGMVANVEKHYTEYKIRKKSGGDRLIEAPDFLLKNMQRWIYINILCKDLSINDCVHGFIPAFKNRDKVRGILTNAAPHAGHDWLINVDLKNFFHTVELDNVNNYFHSLGYEDEVVKTLTALCTYKSRLPQGAPTSPMLSNIIASRMDEMMLEYCKKRGIVYTRYADDLTFSADYDVKIPALEDIYKIVYLNGFKVNRMKTKVRYKGCKQEVTGLTVTNGVHVSQKYKKEILRELHFCKKFGVYEHYQHLKTTKGLYKDWLRGKIMFVRQIDPACGNKMLEQFNELNWLV